MLKANLSTALGFLILLVVVAVALMERGSAEIRFFDWHAAIVVVGGVCGSLLLAIPGPSFVAMIGDWFRTVTGRDVIRRELARLKSEISQMEEAWQQGRRAEVLSLTESDLPEIRVAVESLIQHAGTQRLKERFETLRSRSSEKLLPQIEGWDLVARLAPSFGIVGTVAGMVQLFRNMANNQANLGGAMALALLATLYGILMGTALGGPMSTRLNQLLNDHLGTIDLLETRVSALIAESRSRRPPETTA